MIRKVLYAFGYGVGHVLFLGVNTPESVVRRLRLAYRLVGVKILETPQIDETERTIFLCPYRGLGATRFGAKWVCHDVLDRVDDGYVTYLRRHKDIDYHRPTSCDELPYCSESEYCYSDVSPR